MITKWYEITCDYCCSAITHEIGSVKFAEQMLIERGGFIKGKHHVFAGTLVGFYVVAGCNRSLDEIVHIFETCKKVVVVARGFKIPVD